MADQICIIDEYGEVICYPPGPQTYSTKSRKAGQKLDLAQVHKALQFALANGRTTLCGFAVRNGETWTEYTLQPRDEAAAQGKGGTGAAATRKPS